MFATSLRNSTFVTAPLPSASKSWKSPAHLGDVCINDTLELLFQTLPYFLRQHDPNITVTDSTIRIGLEVVEELIHLMQEVIINEIFR
jgi:hypothetical protein